MFCFFFLLKLEASKKSVKLVMIIDIEREKASLPVYMRLVVPNSPAAAILKTEKGLETRLSQESIICVANCLKFE